MLSDPTLQHMQRGSSCGAAEPLKVTENTRIWTANFKNLSYLHKWPNLGSKRWFLLKGDKFASLCDYGAFSPNWCCSKPLWFSFLQWRTKEDILRNVWGFFCWFFCSIQSKSMVTKTVWFPKCLKISSFILCRRQKITQVWNDIKLSKWWKKFTFWVNYSITLRNIGINYWSVLSLVIYI